MTNNPIMHMIRSARVKIHSGHSSQISWGSHLQFFAIEVSVHRRGGGVAEKMTGSVVQKFFSDALFQGRDIEVEDQSDRPAAESEIGQELGVMDRCKFLDGFHLNHDRRFDEQIDPIAAIEGHSLVDDGQRAFSDEVDLTMLKLMTETPRISGFQQPRSQLPMHLDRSTNDRFGKLIQLISIKPGHSSNLSSSPRPLRLCGEPSRRFGHVFLLFDGKEAHELHL
ncbi:MAG TPA: hypothetical protein PKB10_04410, partial [Tepidisphaeraceae bacterium]|nr:hypothetical protein [Tepidisphaeraceae bacterium]